MRHRNLPRLVHLCGALLLAPLAVATVAGSEAADASAASVGQVPSRQAQVDAIEKLRQAIAARLGPEKAARVLIPFEVAGIWLKLASEVTFREAGAKPRLDLLALALRDPGRFGLSYDRDQTHTADGTFAAGRGDCLSLTHVFIGLSRALGYDTYYVEAHRPGSFGTEGDLTIEYRHICAGYGRSGATTIYDFDRIADGIAIHRRLTDIEALARHYNTVGYQALRRGEHLASIDAFRLASELDPRFAWPLNSLGAALQRTGDLPGAERAFRESMARDPRYVAPVRNLAGLHRSQGRPDLAAPLERLADRLRSRNPYEPLRKGYELLPNDPRRARAEFARALALDGALLAARVGRARAFLAEGDRRAARRELRRVLRRDPDFAPAHALAREVDASEPPSSDGSPES